MVVVVEQVVLEKSNLSTPYTASPLDATAQIYQLQLQGYPITVGGGGAGQLTPW